MAGQRPVLRAARMVRAVDPHWEVNGITCMVLQNAEPAVVSGCARAYHPLRDFLLRLASACMQLVALQSIVDY